MYLEELYVVPYHTGLVQWRLRGEEYFRFQIKGSPSFNEPDGGLKTVSEPRVIEHDKSCVGGEAE